PWIAVMLNFSPDHLDRHPTVAAYGAAKARIFENQEASDFAVVNADDPSVLELASQARARTLYFARDAAVADGTAVENAGMVRRGDAHAHGDVRAGGVGAHSASGGLDESHDRAASRAVDEPAAHGVSRGAGESEVPGESRAPGAGAGGQSRG